LPCTYLAHHEPESVNIVIVIIYLLKLVDLIGMHRTDCSGETRLALHIPGNILLLLSYMPNGVIIAFLLS